MPRHMPRSQNAHCNRPANRPAMPQPGVTEVGVTLPPGAVWYEALSGTPITPKSAAPVSTGVHMDAIPVFYRGGHIVPRRCARTHTCSRVLAAGAGWRTAAALEWQLCLLRAWKPTTTAAH